MAGLCVITSYSIHYTKLYEFLRVGAFALGHAALSHTVLTLAEGIGCGGPAGLGWWLVMVLGNTFTLVLEGLLVFVQTTRLVLFVV